MLFEIETKFRVEVDGTFSVGKRLGTIVLSSGGLVGAVVCRLRNGAIFHECLKDGGCPGRARVDSSVASDDGTVFRPRGGERSWGNWGRDVEAGR